jgi:SAM-dependent methyltransferase
MQNTTGLTSDADFASHGSDFWLAFSAASSKPLSDCASILDFGCGCGRFARMFKGHRGHIAGCDIDRRHVEWCSAALKFMATKLSNVYPPIPFEDNEFEAVISISIFTHLNESSQDIFLRELARVCRPGGFLFLTVHGERALARALAEPQIKAMLDMEESRFQVARKKFSDNEYAFVLQQGHLTTAGLTSTERMRSNKAISDRFEYGITFIPEGYLRSHWGNWFEVTDYRPGALHDFQDIVVLTPKK